MNVGLYFGSFNPVHHGHLIIANHILSHTQLDKIWMLVSPQNPLKKSNSLLNENHRYHLLQLALDGAEGITASNVEFKLPRPSYTIDTLTYLADKYPTYNFTVIMGSDSFVNLHKWKNYELILQRYSILIYVRPGFPVPEELPKNASIVTAPMLEISSTYIRTLLKERKSIQYLLPKNVVEYIEENNYYR